VCAYECGRRCLIRSRFRENSQYFIAVRRRIHRSEEGLVLFRRRKEWEDFPVGENRLHSEPCEQYEGSSLGNPPDAKANRSPSLYLNLPKCTSSATDRLLRELRKSIRALPSCVSGEFAGRAPRTDRDQSRFRPLLRRIEVYLNNAEISWVSCSTWTRDDRLFQKQMKTSAPERDTCGVLSLRRSSPVSASQHSVDKQ